MPIVSLQDQWGNDQGVSPFGSAYVTTDGSVIFLDTFDGTTLDVTNRWTTGGTVIPTQPSGGSALINPGTAISASSSLVSQPTFQPSGYVVVAFIFQAEAAPAATGNHRFFGLGTQPGSWTAATPLQDAIGFEITTTGVFRGVVWSGGVLQEQAALPQNIFDGVPHLLLVAYRPGATFLLVDSSVKATNRLLSSPSTQALPIRQHSINGLSITVGTPTISLSLSGFVDYSSPSKAQNDGTYAWRKQTVGTRGDAVTSLMDGNKTTYSASVTGAAGVVGDTLVITGSATKTVRVTRISVSGVATALANVDIQVIKRSAADTGGTSSGVALTPMDSANAAATAVVTLYTVAPTPGAAVGTPIRSIKYGAVASTSGAVVVPWDMGNGPKQCPVLRGVAQQLAINFSTAPAGGSFDIDIELTEE